ncbi:unnamed protein product [Echinostoma caproni]|uniref:Histone-lysine N-methyltransferase n=1 Tax=Echinostoma caproni TaxID=27848 RepID=A0A183AA43_9TREM|nr:unnamed protein product [Echinostoma caproni]
MCEVYSNAPGQMFKCRGPCGRLVHPACMRYKIPPPADNNREDRFQCPECLTGNYLCRICGKPGDSSAQSTVGPVIPCQSPGCGRHFHRDCLLDWPGVTTRPPGSNNGTTKSADFQLIKCPAHCCNTCVSELDESFPTDAPLPGSKDRELLQCVRRGVFPRYAQIVWAKIQHFRWWPCEIIHARNAPMNILNMARPEGTFPIHFLGSDEYQWIARGCVLPYEIGLKTSAAKDSLGSKSVEKAFTRALGRAPRAHQLYVNHVVKRELPLTSMHAESLPDEELLPPTAMDADIVIHRNLDEDLKMTATAYMTLIESNVYWTEELLRKVRDDEDSKLSSLESCCTCSSAAESNSPGKCTLEIQCPNVMASIECDRQRCSFGTTDCGNRQFSTISQNLEHDLFNVVRTVNRGYGVKTTIPFSEHALVMEFRGEVVDIDEANRRLTEALGPSALANLSSSRKGFQPLAESYLIRLGPDRDLVLDAASKGNLARFINHSCEPNLVAECWIVDGLPRLGLFATRAITANEELTLDYVLADFLATGLMGSQSLCLCGTDTCVSTLHLPASFPPVTTTASKTEEFPQPETARSPAPERRKSRRTDPQATETKPEQEKPERSEQVLSVANLLAAAALNRSSARRPLIQPSTAAARASKELGKAAPVTLSNRATTKSAQSKIEESLPLTLRPPPHEDFCYRSVAQFVCVQCCLYAVDNLCSHLNFR